MGGQARVPSVPDLANGRTALQVTENLALLLGAVEGQWPRISPVGQMSPHPAGIWASLGSQDGISPSPCGAQLGIVPPQGLLTVRAELLPLVTNGSRPSISSVTFRNSYKPLPMPLRLLGFPPPPTSPPNSSHTSLFVAPL